MSTALAIAGVTQVLRDLLNDRFVNQNVAGQIGQSVAVSTMPPDKVVQQNGVEVTPAQSVPAPGDTPNIGWRNEGLPSRDGTARTRSNPSLALNLHYLISAYGAADLHAEILLGHAMQLLHENPVVPREAIRIALQPPPDQAGTLPPWLRALRDSGLQDQIEQLRITPEFLSTEDMSKFWTVDAGPLPVRVPLTKCRWSRIQAVDPQAESTRPCWCGQLPGVARGSDPPWPTLTLRLVPQGPAKRRGTRRRSHAGKVVALDGTSHEVILTNDRFEIEETVPGHGRRPP